MLNFTVCGIYYAALAKSKHLSPTGIKPRQPARFTSRAQVTLTSNQQTVVSHEEPHDLYHQGDMMAGHAARMGTCKILTEGRGLNSSGSRQRPVSGCCGDGDEPWGLHKAGVISWLAARFSRTILFHAASYDRFAYQSETELGRERKDEGKQWRKSDPGSEGRVTTFTASRSHSPQEPATWLSNIYTLEGQGSSCEKEDAFLEET